MNNGKIEKVESFKFLGALLDECISPEYIKYIENKISKSIGLLYRTKSILKNRILIGTVLLLH